MATKIDDISFDRPIVESDGSLTLQSRGFFRQITDRSLIVGTGSPEGVIEATQGASYMNNAGTASAIMYLKRDDDDGLGDRTKGWFLV